MHGLARAVVKAIMPRPQSSRLQNKFVLIIQYSVLVVTSGYTGNVVI